MTMLHGLGGLVAMLAIAFVFSEDRRAIPVRVVVAGVALQIALALLLVKFPPAVGAIAHLSDAVNALQRATDAGTRFVFGYLAGGTLPFAETKPGAGFILVFRAFPLVLTISALAALLFHWGILQRVVGIFAWCLRKSLGIGGPLGIGAAVHVFVGMVEAPLLIRPWLRTMSRGELMALMTCGMAGIAGTVMVVYAALLGPIVPDAFANILIASILGTPAALAVAAIMVPFHPDPEAAATIAIEDAPVNAMDAIVRGTMDGIKVLTSLIALLIVMIALVALVNMALSLVPPVTGAPLTLQRVFAWLFEPILWLIGIPSEDLPAASMLMGTKTVLNEFVAYVDLAALPEGALSPHSRLIMTYALCGFANFGSLGIMIGGMTAMAPERRHEIIALGPRSILGGTLATCMSGAVIGMI
jgi:CNT family concentrative nucleoside transporter